MRNAVPPDRGRLIATGPELATRANAARIHELTL
jgi:hypothetical protein